MPTRTRAQITADRRSRELRRALGTDLRHAREDQGITLRRVADAAGIDPAHLTRIEGGNVAASVEVLQRVAAVLGGDVGVRYFPGTGATLRDHIQAAIVEALISGAHRVWRRAPEVAVHRPARGVIDLVLWRADKPTVVAVEVHSQIRRLEQLIRWTNLKRESLASSDLWPMLAPDDAAPTSSLLVLRSTAATRGIARDHAATLAAAYPADSRLAAESLLQGSAWPGSAIVWADYGNGAATIRPVPPGGVGLVTDLR